MTFPHKSHVPNHQPDIIEQIYHIYIIYTIHYHPLTIHQPDQQFLGITDQLWPLHEFPPLQVSWFRDVETSRRGDITGICPAENERWHILKTHGFSQGKWSTGGLITGPFWTIFPWFFGCRCCRRSLLPSPIELQMTPGGTSKEVLKVVLKPIWLGYIPHITWIFHAVNTH